MGTITDGVETTDRFGMKLDVAGTTPWSRARIIDSLRAVEEQGMRCLSGPLSERPAASLANDRLCWWDGLRLSICDGQSEEPGWHDLDSTSYVNIMDYGALPIPDPDYAPRKPANTVGLANWDPFEYWRPFDVSVKATEAHNDAIRTHRPLFFPPGNWAVFGDVVFSGGDAPIGLLPGASSGRPTAPASGVSLPKRSMVIGVWPDTHIWCFPATTGNDSGGNPVEKPGLTNVSKVFSFTDVYGVLDKAHIEGFTFKGPVYWASQATMPDVAVMEVVGFETNATIAMRNVEVGTNINPYSSAVDLSVGSFAVTNQNFHLVENVNIAGPGIPYANRLTTFGLFINQWYTRGINCSLPNVLMRNVRVEGYQVAVGRYSGNGSEMLLIDGLRCKGSAYADLFVLGTELRSAGTVKVTNYSSTDSARSFEAEWCDLSLNGLFACTYTGVPGDSAYGQVDFGRLNGSCRLELNEYEASTSGGAVRTIAVNQYNGRVDIDLRNTIIDAPVASLVRSTGGSDITVGAWNHTQCDGFGAFVAREIRIPVPLADIITVDTSDPSATLDDASDLATVRSALGWLLKLLGVGVTA